MGKDNLKKDIIFISILVVFLLFTITKSYSQFISRHMYWDGFIKFSILATMGELLSERINSKVWKKTQGLIWRIGIWGVFGSLVALMFTIFSEGVIGAQKKGLLVGNNSLFTAFFTSIIMNTTSGPVMMGLQRIGTTYIDLRYKKNRTSFKEVIEIIDWTSFICFEVFTTIPLIWIPANTLTFLMSEKYRILIAALLSMILGLILTLGKMKQKTMKV
ncbi:hypothetical protein ACF3M2_18155 [Tissierella carlieri]|jgi:hypothetical protein|uniref:Mpv17 / PMP22 family protein n=1 Tax=Tissierella carlieri TaxID=689904 RepID=A0ABT1SG78_9FIRM|nr:hypothetical protein [Tissierella carlieri]MCQ4925506.1 hypothetical protein [Tissierella carlieri]